MIFKKENEKRISFILKRVKKRLFSSSYERRKNEKKIFSFSMWKKKLKKSFFFHVKRAILFIFFSEKSFFSHVKRKIEKNLFFFFMWEGKSKKIPFLSSCKKRRKESTFFTSHVRGEILSPFSSLNDHSANLYRMCLYTIRTMKCEKRRDYFATEMLWTKSIDMLFFSQKSKFYTIHRIWNLTFSKVD